MKTQTKLELECNSLLYPQRASILEDEIVMHDIQILQTQIQEQVQMNYDLQDYVSAWCHEVKLPLSALLLMNEKNKDVQLRSTMKEQLEKIRQQLNLALLGCKAQGSIFDLQIKATSLEDCVKTSIKNNQFFLIHNHFELAIDSLQEIIYTDKEWLVYVLDQLLSNAIKYHKQQPTIRIGSKKTNSATQLFIEDQGIGIAACDQRVIYDKGFTGRNLHNGKYKSTGMGLYLVAIILQKLGHRIDVESEEGNFTRFTITFQDNRDYFHL